MTSCSSVVPGERLPDLRAPLADGSHFVLSEDAAGIPVAIVTGPNAPRARNDLLVIHIARSTNDDVEAASPLTVLDDGQITAALAGHDGPATAVIAGPDHRVVAAGPASQIDQLVTLLPLRGEPVRRTSSTPLLVVDQVIDGGLGQRLIEHAQSTGWTASPMLRPDDDGNALLQPDASKQRGDHLLVDEALAAEVIRCLSRRLLPEVARSLAHHITSHEQLKIVRYRSGSGWFEPHRDNTAATTRRRRLAVTINLRPSGAETGRGGPVGYTGGELRFPELGPDLWCPEPGAAIVFSCGLLHEVTPVISGARHALLTFLS